MSEQKTNPKLRRVAIVEDDSGLRDQLQKILKSAPGVCCVGTFSSAEKALEGMLQCSRCHSHGHQSAGDVGD